MNIMCDFSVLIPVYIKENPEFLVLAIQSIMEQTLQPSEIVIVKDGPLTPELDNIINSYATKYPTIFNILKFEENCGMGAAMDYGLRNCKYDLVARMDSDDIARPDRFQKQISFLKENPDIALVGSYIEEFSAVPGDLNRFRKVPVSNDEIRIFAKQRNPINHMTVLMKKDAAIRAGSYWHKRVLEDYNLWYKMLMQGCKFYNLAEPLVYARVGNNMVGRRRGFEYLKQEIKFSRTMCTDNFISRREFYIYSATRIMLRLMPLRMLNIVYAKLLRR